MSTLIREATGADAGTLARLGQVTSEAYFSDIWSPAEMQAFMERDFSEAVLRAHIEDPDRYTYTLFEKDNNPVGFARINWKRHVPLSDAVGAELQKIYFLPGNTGQGMGTQLLLDAIERVRERKDHLMWLDVLTSNQRARKLYEYHGFTVTGRLPFRTELVDIGMHVMVRRENSPA